MANRKLDFIVVHVSDRAKQATLAELASETHLRMIQETADEIQSAATKSLAITQIDNAPANVTGLKMTGKTSVENIEITYTTADGETHTKGYTRKEFYAL
ncbi:hypothetical protein HY486_03840 [Candidatus Woesearchaeota archaeon]|nr:hypothetical protein [Candidatus Woesearchaeota archaeon]